MKTSSDDLHKLIHSLSKTEKGYYKKFAKRFGGKDEDNNYIKIFDAIAVMEEYNEAKLKDKFKKESFVKHFPVIKQHLYHQILQSLYLYNSDKTVESKLRELMNEHDALYHKGLFRQAYKLVNRAKEIALENEKYPVCIMLNGLERNLLLNLPVNNREEKLNEIFAYDIDMLQRAEINITYSWLYDRICDLMGIIGFVRTAKQKKLFDNIVNYPIMSSEDKAITPRAKRLYYDIYSVYYHALGDFQKVYEYSEKTLKLIELGKGKIVGSVSNYLVALQNHVQFCAKVGKFDEAEEVSAKLKNFIKNNKHEIIEYMKPLVLARNLLIMLDMYLGSYNIKAAAPLIPEIESLLKKSGEQVDRLDRVLITYIFGKYYFIIGKYEKALEYINKILNSEEEEGMSDVYCFAKMLNLMIHFELKNYELIEYLLVPTRKYISKKDKLYDLEALVLTFFGKVVKSVNEKEELQLFDEFIYRLRKNSSYKDDSAIREMIDFVSWAQSKLKGYKSLYEYQLSLQTKAV